MIKMVIMAQIHMKIFKPFDRAIRETLCLKLIVINLFRYTSFSTTAIFLFGEGSRWTRLVW